MQVPWHPLFPRVAGWSVMGFVGWADGHGDGDVRRFRELWSVAVR